MPILDVEIVGSVPPAVRQGLARRLADAVGDIFASRPQGTWVKLRFIESDAYAENAGGPAQGTQPVIVSVLQAERSEGAELADLAARLTEAIASTCSRPAENVHIIFEPAAAGRIAFGGQVRT